MKKENPIALTHTAEYLYIDFALKARWQPFNDLNREISSFIPRGESEYLIERKVEYERLMGLNPDASKDELEMLADKLTAAQMSPDIQFHIKFNKRYMAEYVNIVFLSHALCEATINAILAIGLSKSKSEDIFAILERANIGEKWQIAPKILSSDYELPKGKPLFQTLNKLIQLRNSLVHYKISVEIQGASILKGSSLHRDSIQNELQLLKRFFSLPYDLLEHASSTLSDRSLLFILDREEINRVHVHRK